MPPALQPPSLSNLSPWAYLGLAVVCGGVAFALACVMYSCFARIKRTEPQFPAAPHIFAPALAAPLPPRSSTLPKDTGSFSFLFRTWVEPSEAPVMSIAPLAPAVLRRG